MGPKSNDRYHHNRQKERRHTGKLVARRRTQRLDFRCHKPRHARGHRRLGEARERSRLELPGGARPRRHLDFRLWPPGGIAREQISVI